jgi:glycosyltransferase involved in cell wall biosynthesis
MISPVRRVGSDKKIELSVVVPIWNDEENIIPFLQQIEPLLQSSAETYEIIFCVDPSNDGTELALQEICKNNNKIKSIFFAARAGQPQSTLAGLTHSLGSAVIVIDVDLQDPPNLIPEMISKWREGSVLVIPRRISRSGEPISKRFTAAMGYAFLSKFGSAPIPKNTGDYRLMDRSIVARVLSLPESHVFLRGLVSLVEQNPTFIEFERPARAHGKTKYNKWFGGIKSGLNGIVSYSTALLDWLIVIGLLMAFTSFVIGLINIIYKLTGHSVAEGSTQLIAMVTFIGGIQLVGLGILGLYVGRIYEESKGRPRWFVRQTIGISQVDLNDSMRSNGRAMRDKRA